MVDSNVENIRSISSVSGRAKDSTRNKFINCICAIKIYNAKIGGVDLMDQLKSA